MKRKRCGEVVDVIANLMGVQESNQADGHGNKWDGRLPLMKNLRLLGVATEDGVFDSKGAQRNPDSTGRFTLATRGAVTVICSKNSLANCYPGDKIAIANYVGEKSRHSMLPGDFRLPTLVKATSGENGCPESYARILLQAIMKDLATRDTTRQYYDFLMDLMPNWVDVFYNKAFADTTSYDDTKKGYLQMLATGLTIPTAGSSLWRSDANAIRAKFMAGGGGARINWGTGRIETPTDYKTAQIWLQDGPNGNRTVPGRVDASRFVASLQEGDSFDLAYRKAIQQALTGSTNFDFRFTFQSTNAASAGAPFSAPITNDSVECIGCLLEKLDQHQTGDNKTYAAARILLRPT